LTFASGHAELLPAHEEALEPVADFLKAHPTARLTVSGHTDNRGSEPTGWDLSKRRALAVVDFLVSQGIDPARLTAQWLAHTRPVTSNDTAAGRAANRRVELTVTWAG
jgi:outer membrane protein OmpA-like peptidoglycan-associated protein